MANLVRKRTTVSSLILCVVITVLAFLALIILMNAKMPTGEFLQGSFFLIHIVFAIAGVILSIVGNASLPTRTVTGGVCGFIVMAWLIFTVAWYGNYLPDKNWMLLDQRRSQTGISPSILSETITS